MPGISLTPELEADVKRIRKTGRYANNSEIVRAALRLLIKQELEDYLNPPPLNMEKVYRRESAAQKAAELRRVRRSISKPEAA